MRPTARPLFVLYDDAFYQARIRQAAGGRFEACAVACWTTLWSAVNHAKPTAVLIVDPYHGVPSRSSPAPQLKNLLRSYPSVPVLGIMEPASVRMEDARTLGEWGVSILLSANDGAGTISQVLSGTEGHALRSFLAHSLPATLSTRARALLSASLDAVIEGGQVTDLAHALHLSPRTLLRRSQEMSLPSPRHLLGWMRVLLAAELLDQPGRSVGSVAHTCHYSSDTGLRRALHDVLGTTPMAMRDAGAFATASTRFLRLLSTDVN